MILELGGGRELKLPDDMDEEIARQLGKLILATEQRAKDAEQGLQGLREEVQALRAKADTPAPQIDLAPLAATIKEGNARTEAMLSRVLSAVSADRIMTTDETGAPRSRIAR